MSASRCSRRCIDNREQGSNYLFRPHQDTSGLVWAEMGSFDTLPKMKLKILQSLAIKKKVNTANGIMQLCVDRVLFAHLAVLVQNRAMSMIHTSL